VSALVYKKIEGRDGAMALDMNECLVGLGEGGKGAFDDLDSGRFERYPEYAALIRAASESFGIEPERLRPTAGADEGISVTVQAWLGRGKRVAVPDPVFSMYDVRAAAMGSSFSRVGLDGDFRLDPAAFIDAARGADLAVLVNPGNPAGAPIPADSVEEICRALSPSPVAVDEAYADFAGESVMDRIDRIPNAVILRSLSKSYAIAGLRVGFLAGRPEILETLDPFILPYGISRPSAKAATALLGRRGLMEDLVARVLVARKRTADMLARHLPRAVESGANFVLGWVGKGAVALRDAMAERGLLAKAWDSGSLSGWLRLSACPSEWEAGAEKALAGSIAATGIGGKK
jgi:histidinol-phosphate aminotransferase